MKNGWQITTLGEACDVDKSQANHKQLPYVGLEHIESHTGRFIGTTEPLAVKSSTFKFAPEHLLYGRLRPYLNKVMAPNFEGHCSTEIFPFKPKVGLTREFLYYWFLREATVAAIDATSTGTRMPRANIKAVLGFEFPLPPLPEQRRIVGILDEAFAAIATAKANFEANLKNARALFESHLNAVFTQRGDGWTDMTLGEACENLDSKRVPITKSKRVVGEYPYYGASGVVDYVSDYIFDEDLLLVSEDGANLLARTYSIAFSVSGKVWVNNHAHVLRFPELASQRFIEFYLNSIKLDPYVSGMAQPKLNQKSLNSIPVPAPPLPQREAIVAQLDSLQDETQRFESIYQRKLAVLDELKKSLLRQAFSGQL